jgi:hypothetical protein
MDSKWHDNELAYFKIKVPVIGVDERWCALQRSTTLDIPQLIMLSIMHGHHDVRQGVSDWNYNWSDSSPHKLLKRESLTTSHLQEHLQLFLMLLALLRVLSSRSPPS